MFLRPLLFLLLLLLTTTTVIHAAEETTCVRMDVAVIGKIAEGLCNTRCSAKKCSSGVCKKVGARPTCLCGGCSEQVPLDSESLKSQ